MEKRILSGVFSLLFFFAACSPDPVPNEDIPAEDRPRYEIISDQTYDYSDFITDLIDESSMTSGLSGMYKTLIKTALAVYSADLKTDCGLDDSDLGFRKVNFAYRSVDQYGQPVTLSAMAFWIGAIDGKHWWDISPENICLVEHFTITSDAECPTEGFPFEAFINRNALVVMPDYIGYGITSDMVHPYMNHELCATNSIDALAAGYTLFEDLSKAGLSKDWKLTVLGASQGGGNALAVHKRMDTDPQLAEKWRFAGSYCAAGPYDPGLTVDKYIEAGKTDHPVLFPLTLEAMKDSYPDVFGRFDDESIYSDKYISHKSEIDAALQSREHTTSEMNDMLVELLKDPSGTAGIGELLLDDILSAELIDKDSAVCKALYECLEKNDLTQGWTPVRPMKLYYSEADKVVPCDNALAVYDAFGGDKVTLVKGLPLEHGTCCALWMLDVITSD